MDDPIKLRESYTLHSDIIHMIEAERYRQRAKYGVDRNLSIGDYLVILRKELEEAEEGFVKCKTDEHSAINEIKQIAAVCVACLEEHLKGK